jgi:hypothetical protein
MEGCRQGALCTHAIVCPIGLHCISMVVSRSIMGFELFGDKAKLKEIIDKLLAIKTAKADAACLAEERDAKMVEEDRRREAEKEEEKIELCVCKLGLHNAGSLPQWGTTHRPVLSALLGAGVNKD